MVQAALSVPTREAGYCLLLIRVTTVEVCDARDDDSSTAAGHKKIDIELQRTR